MENKKGTLSLAESMELTMDKSNLSVVGDIGEVIIDAAMDDGIFKDIPVIGAIVGASKCIKNVSDVLFTKKLIAFLFELRDTDVHEREEAIAKWESDAKYRIRVGEVLLNMINRCDDTQKAKWLFYCSDKDVKELLRNDKIMKIVKEYCNTHKWRESFKRRIWNLL